VRASLPGPSPAPHILTNRRHPVSKSTLPRLSGRISNYCWAEHTGTRVHCTEPFGHSGRHWHPYSKTSW
jgi:hypothetical protein